jgi:hypothetical protein
MDRTVLTLITALLGLAGYLVERSHTRWVERTGFQYPSKPEELY